MTSKEFFNMLDRIGAIGKLKTMTVSEFAKLVKSEENNHKKGDLR
jgi:hypothetical protein